MDFKFLKLFEQRKLIFLLTAAFLIRLFALNQSLWLDEGITARVVSEYSYLEIITKFSPFDFHPPFYYLLTKLWTTIFGLSEVTLRMLSVIFSLLTGWLVYKISKGSTWAAAFFLFNPLIIYYSQEARMYSMVTFFLTLASYAFINKKNVLFNISIFCSFLTFYGSVFIIAAFYLYLIVKKEYTRLFKLLPGFVLAVVCLFPLLSQQWQHSRESLAMAVNWRSVLGTATVKNFILIPLKFVTGRLSFEPKILYYGLGAMLGIAVFGNALRGGTKQKMFLFLFLTPLLFAVIFSTFTPLLQYFRFIYLIPLLSLLIYFGTSRIWQRGFVLAGFICFALLYLLVPQFHREDWKSVGSFVRSRNVPVLMIHPSSDALRYYLQKDVTELRSISTQKISAQNIIVVPYTADIYGFNYSEALSKKGYSLQEKKTFREIVVEEWSL